MSIVVSTPDVVGERMAGPGIRAYSIARELGNHFQVTLVARLDSFRATGEPFEAHSLGSSEASRATRKARVIIGQPDRHFPSGSGREKKFVFDLFDPVVLELRELAPYRSGLRHAIHMRREWGRLLGALDRGDLLIAATRRQIDFYSGIRAASGRDMSGWLDRWIELPFGVDEQPPSGASSIDSSSSPVIVWGGGAWPWLDPGTAIEAVKLLSRRGVRCRLLFMGTLRPNGDRSQQGRWHELASTVEEAKDLVSWNEGWVPFGERSKWLRGAVAAIMLHHRTTESVYSIRTRFFDALWCGVPIVATAGGFVADLVANEKLGVVTEPEDVESVAAAIEKLIADDGFRRTCVSNLERVRPRYYWSTIMQPLVASLRRWL